MTAINEAALVALLRAVGDEYYEGCQTLAAASADPDTLGAVSAFSLVLGRVKALHDFGEQLALGLGVEAPDFDYMSVQAGLSW